MTVCDLLIEFSAQPVQPLDVEAALVLSGLEPPPDCLIWSNVYPVTPPDIEAALHPTPTVWNIDLKIDRHQTSTQTKILLDPSSDRSLYSCFVLPGISFPPRRRHPQLVFVFNNTESDQTFSTSADLRTSC
ncbi:hypothetical protein BaRGS_00036674 [Batillaria attramentaria]|uniref:Uncharacterized protein n=1 Tax=Batillaria attramentaria TaxID=370345 RepID=A0ABD0JB54_9CAEN